MEAKVQPLKMAEKLPALINRYWQDVWERKRDGRLVAWCTGGSPHEILRAMDITVVYPESYSAFCSIAGRSTELCERADVLGYSPDLCSAARNFVGLTFSTPALEPQTLPYGGMPKPGLLVCQPSCPGIYKIWEKWSRFFDVPLLVIERPILHDALSKEEIAHLVKNTTEELREMATFLGGFVGRPLDYDLLSQSLALEHEASVLWRRILAFCRHVPAPMSAFDAFTHVYPFYLYRGESEAVNYYRELEAEVAERVAQRIVPIVAEEKYRLYWDNLPVFFKIADLTKKFASYGAVPVVGMFPFCFGYSDLDTARPLESIAELLLFNPARRGIKRRSEFLAELLAGYSLDGLVMQRSRTCLLMNMGQDDITKTLIDKTGLPAMVMEGDVCDARFYNDTESNSKIDAFMEILAQRGAGGRRPTA